MNGAHNMELPWLMDMGPDGPRWAQSRCQSRCLNPKLKKCGIDGMWWHSLMLCQAMSTYVHCLVFRKFFNVPGGLQRWDMMLAQSAKLFGAITVQTWRMLQLVFKCERKQPLHCLGMLWTFDGAETARGKMVGTSFCLIVDDLMRKRDFWIHKDRTG